MFKYETPQSLPLSLEMFQAEIQEINSDFKPQEDLNCQEQSRDQRQKSSLKHSSLKQEKWKEQNQ